MPTTTPPTTTELPFVSPASLLSKLADSESDLAAAVRAAAPGGEAVALPARRAAAVTQLPILLNNRRRWQQSAYTQDNLQMLADGSQVVVLIDKDLAQKVCKRSSIDSTKWTTADVSHIFGPQIDDSHNTLTITALPDGHLWLNGNMHSEPFKAGRTTVPGDITTFVPVAGPAVNASLGTYCMHPPAVGTGDPSTRTQFEFWRDGHATSGDFFYRKYDPALSGYWTDPVKLFDGNVSGEGAYLNRIAVRGNKIGLFFCWRGAGDASTNTDLGYVESLDGGTTWQRIDGSAQTVPITHANAQTIIATPIETGLINQCGADLDIDGHPHAVEQLYAADGTTHLYHIWHNGTAWITEDITPDWTLRVETIAQTTLNLKVSRPQIICTAAGKTYVIVRTIGEGLNGRPLLIDVSPGASRRPAFLFDHDLAGWEPAFDATALRERDELHGLLTSIDQNADSKKGWIAQAGWVFVAPCSYLPDIAAGTARIGGIRKVAEFPAPVEIAAVGSVTEGNIVNFGIPQVDVQKIYGQGAKLFARLSFRATFNSGTTSAKVYLRETPSAGSLPTADICTIDMVNSSLAGVVSSPWEPLQQSPYVETTGQLRDTRLIPRMVCDNAAGVRMGAWNVEIGVLDSY